MNESINADSQEGYRTQAEQLRHRLRLQQRDTVDLHRDAAMLREISASPKLLLSRMHQAGVAHRIQGGRYFVNLDEGPFVGVPLLDALEPLAHTVLERLNRPYYLSWHTALYHYGLLEQQSSVIYCAVGARKRPVEFRDFSVQFITLKQERFFGIEPIPGFAQPVRMAAIEKALLDALERPDLTAPYAVVLAAFAEAAETDMLDPQRLVTYTIETGKDALTRRIGFLMDRYELPGSDLLLDHIGARALEPLSPGGSRQEGTVDRKWRLRVPEQLILTAENLK